MLGRALIEARARRRDAEIVAFGTKPADETLSTMDWPILRSWDAREYGQKQVVLWPEYGDPETAADRQKRAFRPVLRQLFMEGNRTLYFDEIRDIEHRLGFGDLIDEFWLMGRSNKLTIVAGTQRPRWVSRSMFSEPEWIFSFPLYDTDDLRRLADIGGGDTHAIQRIVSNLDKHTFLCFRRSTRELVISKVEL